MIDIIQEIEDLKSYVAGKAATNTLFPSYPPQHPWAAGTSVEQMINKLDELKEKIISDQKDNQGTSAAARMLRNTIEYSEIPSEYYTRLLEIANMIEYEYNNIKNTETTYEIPVGIVPNCQSLIAYIQSYVESNGPCTKRFIQGLYDFIDRIDTQIVNLSSENNSLRKDNESLANRSSLLMRIHDIIDRN